MSGGHRKASLYPSDPFEAAMTDAVVDTWRDLLDHFYECAFHRVVVDGVLSMRMRNHEERARLYATFMTYEARPTFEKLEAMMPLPSISGDESDATARVSWADLAVFDVVRTFERTLTQGEDLLPAGRFPRLTAMMRVSVRTPFTAHREPTPHATLGSLQREYRAFRRVCAHTPSQAARCPTRWGSRKAALSSTCKCPSTLRRDD